MYLFRQTKWSLLNLQRPHLATSKKKRAYDDRSLVRMGIIALLYTPIKICQLNAIEDVFCTYS